MSVLSRRIQLAPSVIVTSVPKDFFRIGDSAFLESDHSGLVNLIRPEWLHVVQFVAQGSSMNTSRSNTETPEGTRTQIDI